jgi:phosphoribosylanthranilate isomerase
MIWIKICGTTNLEDAHLAVDAGADALGFIFAPSPRRIAPANAAEIIRKLPKKTEKIGVFVDQRPQYIRETIAKSGVTGIQFQRKHGPELAERLKREIRRLKVTKVEPVSEWLKRMEKATGFFLREGTRWIDRLMFDNGAGGTGQTFAWERSSQWIRAVGMAFPKIIIAGGLTPENVGEAIRFFRPWGVDVVSGVESKPGKKDPQKLRAFIRAVREADKSQSSL